MLADILAVVGLFFGVVYIPGMIACIAWKRDLNSAVVFMFASGWTLFVSVMWIF